MNDHLEEVKIASNIIKNINQNDLLMRDISSLDRIIRIYFSQKRRDINEEKQVIDFIFKCLDVRGPDCSILFTHLAESSERENVIKRLHEEYKDKFDFNLVNSSLFESSYQKIKNEEKMKNLFYFSVIFAPLCFICLIFLILRNNQTIKKLNEAGQINKKLEEELTITKQNFDEEVKIKIKLQEELSVRNKIDDHLENFKEKIENEVKSKEKIEEEIKKRQIIEEELENIKKQLENAIQTNKELDEKLQNKEKIEKELNAVNQKCDEQVKIIEDLKNQLKVIKTTTTNADYNEENKSENSTFFSDKFESNKRIHILYISIILTFFFIMTFIRINEKREKKKSMRSKKVKELQEKKPKQEPEPIMKRRKNKPDNF